MRAWWMIIALALGACGWTPSVGRNGSDVGGGCQSDISCDEICVTGSNFFPGGQCTWRCTKTSDCPTGAICTAITLAGSNGYKVCAASCKLNSECRDGQMCAAVPTNEGGMEDVCWAPGTVGP
jgi:hypothetical protein